MTHRFQFLNNFSDTLTTAITSTSATTIEAPSTAIAKLNTVSFASDDHRLALTLVSSSNPDTLEIIYVTWNDGAGNLTVLRGQEGTTAATWPVGTIITCRFTAAQAQAIPFNKSSVDGSDQSIVLGWTHNDITGIATIPTSTSVSYSEQYKHGNYIYVVARGGVTDASLGTFTDNTTGAYFTFGTATFSYVGTVSDNGGAVVVGNRTLNDDYGVAVGESSWATGNSSVAIGNGAVSMGYGNIAVGNTSRAIGNYSTSYGSGASAVGLSATALGPYSYSKGDGALAFTFGFSDVRYVHNFGTIPMVLRDNWIEGWGNASNIQGGEVVIGSPYFELGTVPTWTTATTYTDGDIVRPTVDNGKHYYCYVTSSMDDTYPRTFSGGTTEPDWSGATTDGNSVNLSGGSFVCYPKATTGYNLTTPNGYLFFPTEIGFVCLKYSSVTAAPFVSIGTSANNTLFVNNTQINTISGTLQRHVFTLASKNGVRDLNFKLNTAATGANAHFHGRFYVRGFYMQDLG